MVRRWRAGTTAAAPGRGGGARARWEAGGRDVRAGGARTRGVVVEDRGVVRGLAVVVDLQGAVSKALPGADAGRAATRAPAGRELEGGVPDHPALAEVDAVVLAGVVHRPGVGEQEDRVGALLAPAVLGVHEAGVVALDDHTGGAEGEQHPALEVLPGRLRRVAAGHGLLVAEQVDRPAGLDRAEESVDGAVLEQELVVGARRVGGGALEEGTPAIDEEGAAGRGGAGEGREGAGVGVGSLVHGARSWGGGLTGFSAIQRLA